MRYSVIIPAYKATRFLRECLDSVVAQKALADGGYEILLGVDGCKETLFKAREIGGQYPALRMFWFPMNRGPYVVRNTLAYQARGECLVFFDSDDVMLPGFSEWCDKHIGERGVTRFLFRYKFGSTFRSVGGRGANGVFGIRADLFKGLGGFRPWPCSADTEFHIRAQHAGLASYTSGLPLFIYRKHPGCLTVRTETGGRSALRAQYHAITRRLRGARHIKTRVEPVFGQFEEIAP